MSWTLANVEERNKAHPGKFLIPPVGDRCSLRPGDLVKLVFEQNDPPAGERMWVTVTAAFLDLPTAYEGRLASTPVSIENLGRGDLLTFAPRHVAAIERSRHQASP